MRDEKAQPDFLCDPRSAKNRALLICTALHNSPNGTMEAIKAFELDRPEIQSQFGYL